MLSKIRGVSLTEHEQKALARIHCGGIEGLRTPTFSASTRTVQALFRKNLLDKDGLTSEGRLIAKELADAGVF